MAAQGLRDVGDGHEKIADAREAERLRQRGRAVSVLAMASAVVATAAVVAAVGLP